MRVMSCLVLLCLVIGSGFVASAQAPATPIELLARESKIYAPGIGLVKDGSLLLVEHGRKEEK